MQQLLPLVHDELRRLARRHMAGERPDHVLQATALVNEVYLRLVDIRRVQWQDRAHFFAMAARVMRRVLVDFARAQKNQKRGGGLHRVTLDHDLPVASETPEDVIAIDEALRRWRRSTSERPGRGAAVLWRVERRRDRRGAEDLAGNRDEGLEVRQELADARAVAGSRPDDMTVDAGRFAP